MLAIYDRIETAAGGLLRRVCAGLLAVLLVLPAVNILNRWIPVTTMAWYEEIVTLCFAWMIFLGAAELWRSREMFNVDFFTRLIRQRTILKAVALAVDAVCLLLFLVLLVFGSRWIGGIRSTTAALALPTGVLYASIPASMALMLVMTVRDIAGDIAALYGD